MQCRFSDGSIMVTGSVTKDAELKHVGEKRSAVTSFSMIVGKDKDGNKTFANVKSWFRLAEYAASARKGDAVCAIGRIETREYNGKQYSDLVCNWLNIASTKILIPERDEDGADYRKPEFSELPSGEPDDGELPF